MARKTKEAFLWIIRILNKEKVPYHITGGFAARIYGSKRPLADIDIEIHDKDFKKIMPYVEEYVLKGPLNYKDSQFNIYALFLMYKGQRIDICGSDTQKLYDKKRKKWIKQRINFNDSLNKRIYGLSTKVVPLKDLISYKKIIQRRVDLFDIRQLT
jgi:hypothetical protein